MALARTLGTMVAEARTLVQDKLPVHSGQQRYSDQDFFDAINGAISELRMRRPDLFLPWGLRNPIPYFDPTVDMASPFPLDVSVYTPMVYLLAGRMLMREDTFSDDKMAQMWISMFVSKTQSVT